MAKSVKKNATSRRKKPRLAERRRHLLVENLEPRQMLAAGILESGGVHPDAIIPPDIDQVPRNIGFVGAETFREIEQLTNRGLNDSIATAELVPLGTRLTNQPIVDIIGAVRLDSTPAPTAENPDGQSDEDADYFAFDLRAGDILDLAATGAVGAIDIFGPARTSVFPQGNGAWFALESNQSFDGQFYPDNSPLQTTGTIAGAQVVPVDGRYTIAVSTNATGGSYTVGARTYRPVLESQPIGTEQIFFVDFDGFNGPRSILPPGGGAGRIRIDPMSAFFPQFGLIPQDENELIDKILLGIHENFNVVLPQIGGNGDYDNTGIPGEFGVKILNSRDHADPGSGGHVTRVVIGGSASDIFVPVGGLLGISESIDVGNFDTSEIVFTVLDSVLGFITGVPISGAKSQLDLVAQSISATTSHEIGHSVGIYHTESSSSIPSLMDGGAIQAARFELGPDGIFGTNDDIDLIFAPSDQFRISEGFIGNEKAAASIAHALSTGTGGLPVSGRVFSDQNGDGVGTVDPGLSGVTIFADINSNGSLDASEPQTTTATDGTYTLTIAPGTTRIVAIAPTNYNATTAISQTVTTLPATNVSFGFHQFRGDITGLKYADTNGNGFQDPGEPGLGGVFIYLDLDGDNRIDLGEPRAITAEDGTYNINFPGPGTYTIREVVQSGFVQTQPASGEYTVVYDGTPITQNFLFGNQPARDYGDAPATYPTLVANGGASHGFVQGLGLGANIDQELDGQPNATATGDDTNGLLQPDGTIPDDEDGITLLSPLGPGASADIQVVARNDGSNAFLNAWFDFDQNGTWESGEQVLTDRLVAAGTNVLSIAVPAGTPTGEVFARFRYSRETGLSPGGATDSGEVEDYRFVIQSSASLANNDEFDVSRNSSGNILNVLANDFQTVSNPLIVSQLNTAATRGTVQIAGDRLNVIYTPPNGFVGRDQFDYVVRSSLGQEVSATVVVNVAFQAAAPIAVDDAFGIPQGSFNRPLNVLDNDIPSINGGITIVSAPSNTPNGGTVQISGGQTLLYTPAVGFAGTDQFTYTISDNTGQSSTAVVTVNLLPNAQNDDIVEFILETFDVTNNRPITNVQVGDEFLLRVMVDDIRSFPPEDGVNAAFLDLLYSSELVSTLPAVGGNFPFQISFGPLFDGGNDGFQLGDADTPGLLNEVGGVQTPGQNQNHTQPVELFTVRLQAVAPGVAIFQSDPADQPRSEVLVLGRDTVVPASGLRLGSTELLIVAGSTNSTTAVDDSFPNGIDSNGNSIPQGGSGVLDVLRNDIITSGAQLSDFNVVSQPQFGSVVLQNNGTSNPNDDTLLYQANVNGQGVDRFTYFITDTNGVTRTAEVSVAVGNASSDDLLAIDFKVVDEAGNAITEIGVGSRFGVQVILDDLRGPLDAAIRGVFAGYLDVLYDANLATLSNTFGSDFGFDVVFNSQIFNATAAVGTGVTPGIIDEFGTFQNDSDGSANPLGAEPTLMATLFFEATAAGTLSFTGDKADFSPHQDTLFYDPAGPVAPSRIRYDVASVTITNGAQGEAPLQNQTNRFDVNNDGFVSPIDALSVINTLNRRSRSGIQGESTALDNKVTRFVDVNGDLSVTPIDALLVINDLNRKARIFRVQGESSVQNVTDVPVTDAPLTIGNEDTSPVSPLSEMEPGLNPRKDVFSSAVPQIEDSKEEEESDDVLTLLANDVATVWK